MDASQMSESDWQAMLIDERQYEEKMVLRYSKLGRTFDWVALMARYGSLWQRFWIKAADAMYDRAHEHSLELEAIERAMNGWVD